MKRKASVGKLIPVTLPSGDCMGIEYECLLEWCPLPRTVCEALWDTPLSDAERCQVYEAVIARYLYGVELELPDNLEARALRFWTVMEERRKQGLKSKGVKSTGKDGTDDKAKKPPRKNGKDSEGVDTDTGEMPRIPKPIKASPPPPPPDEDEDDDRDEMLDPPLDIDPELGW